MFLLARAGAGSGADFARGALLYENHCTGCHTSRAHIRDQRKVRSRADLQRWVERWQSTLELGWTRDDVEDVARFLAERFYRFEAVP